MSRVGAEEPPVALLFDTEQEHLISVLAYPFGTLRVGATVALAVDRLAKSEATRIGLLGTGRNALSLLEGVACVRPIRTVLVCSPQAEHRTSFAERAARRIQADVVPVEQPQSAVADVDIILTATNAV